MWETKLPHSNGLPKYDELSTAGQEKLLDAGVLNGCGPGDWRGKGPNWLFRADCNEHDYNYAHGGTDADRRWADWGFYQAMLRDLRRLPWYTRPYARVHAWVFYTLVRLLGRKHFNFAKQPVNINEMIEQHVR